MLLVFVRPSFFNENPMSERRTITTTLIRQVGPVVDGVLGITPLEHHYVGDRCATDPLVNRGPPNNLS